MHIEKRLFDNIFYTVADYPNQLRILNWRGKLKRKVKFTQGTKTKNQDQNNKDQIWKKITNHNYGFNDQIEDKLKFDERTKNKN